MKRLILLPAMLLIGFLCTSCFKFYNHYREFAYGRWELVSIDGKQDVDKDTLYFATATAYKYFNDGKTFTGEYSFYIRTLTTYCSLDEGSLYQEWDVTNMSDSLMVATVIVKSLNGQELPEEENTVGKEITYKKLPY